MTFDKFWMIWRSEHPKADVGTAVIAVRQFYDAELKVQTAAMLEKAADTARNNWSDTRNLQREFISALIRGLIPTDYAAALADREAEIHHGYQCGETYARLVSAQVDSIVAERVREAVLAELEDFSKTLDESDWASTRSNFGDDELMRRILKYRDAAASFETQDKSGETAQPKGD